MNQLGRRPNEWQRRAFKRLGSLYVACGTDNLEFAIVPGRSGPELGAALFQLEHFIAQNHIFQDPYEMHPPTAFKEDPELLPAEQHPELAPYTNLNSSRLKIVRTILQGCCGCPSRSLGFCSRGSALATSRNDVPNFGHEDPAENLKLWFGMPKGCFNAVEDPLFQGISPGASTPTRTLKLIGRVAIEESQMHVNGRWMAHQHFSLLASCFAT